MKLAGKRQRGKRDTITHHYFDIDSEKLFVVCSEHIPEMKRVINEILEDLEIESVGGYIPFFVGVTEVEYFF